VTTIQLLMLWFKCRLATVIEYVANSGLIDCLITLACCRLLPYTVYYGELYPGTKHTIFSAKIAQALCTLAMNIMDHKQGA
jgi:hypothetical protein